jgi:hypothetical protein
MIMNIRNFALIGFASLGLVACQQAQSEVPAAPVEAPADPAERPCGNDAVFDAEQNCKPQ